ncbi:molybdopterin synthase subunit MoaE [Neorhodopirellula lusitana]|uniref:Molybdopterin synthase catalytic subunit n=1 Tax=Neorhodopirellula lusitana TaxID=445327 RepID=A0ABY1PU06_9BACT|nr:molybdenum cofactor biosynthesis protein MoaE [Neorhodopirellula lusitana]SMP46146.1 molybdopterin synthase subunit MoaE [Neorhodopirellula lusitana]
MQIDIQIRLTKGPIHSPQAFPPISIENAGAVVTFRGVVRSTEKPPSEKPTDPAPGFEESIAGLQYQVYEPMTSQELHRLALQQCRQHGVLAMDIEHSFDFVAAGECSFVLQVASRHREAGIRCMDDFIAEMKRHVPIWKIPHWKN